MRWALLCSIVAWTSTGCISMTTEIESIEKTLAAQHFPGSGAAGSNRLVKHSTEVRLDLGRSLTRALSHAQLRRLTFLPQGGVSRLDFVSTLTVRARGTATIPAAEVATIDDTTPCASDGSRDAALDELDIAPYLKAEQPFELVVEARSPSRDWTLGIVVEVEASSDERP